MKKNTNSSPVSRRGAMLAAAATTAAGGAAVLTAGSAEAATGQAVIQGGANNAGAGATSLTSASANPTFSVKNTGSGAGALFQAVNNNGFAGGTFAGNKYGLSAANSGAAGTGAAMAASGVNNTGVLANTSNGEKYAVFASNYSADAQAGGAAVFADGGKNAGAVIFGDPAIVTFGDLVLIDRSDIVSFPSETSPPLFVSWSATDAQVTLTGSVTLDGSGTATVAPGPETAWADMDLASSGSVFVSSNTGPMPNLYAIVDNVAKTLHINGGTAGGTVSYQVTTPRLVDAVSNIQAGKAAVTKATKVADLAREAAKSAK
jgi:hypothetical protein